MAKNEPNNENALSALDTLSQNMAGDLAESLEPKTDEKPPVEEPAEEPAEEAETEESVEDEEAEEQAVEEEDTDEDTSTTEDVKDKAVPAPADKPAQDAATTGNVAQRETGSLPKDGPASAPSAGSESLPDIDTILDAELEPLKEEWGEEFVAAQKNLLKRTIGPILAVARAQLELANAQAEERKQQREESLFLAAYGTDPEENEPHIDAAVKLVKDGVIVAKDGVNPYKLAFAVVKAEAGVVPKKKQGSAPNAKEKAIASTLSAGLGGKRKAMPPTPIESMEPDAIVRHLDDPMFAAFRRGK